MGYHDFAGSGIIHAMAGVGALVTTAFLGPRKNRFKAQEAEMFEPNNPTYIALSTLSVVLSSYPHFPLSCGPAGSFSTLAARLELAKKERMFHSVRQP